jgi:ribonuclease Z
MIWRRAALVVVGLAVVVAAGAFLFQRQIGDAMFRRAVAETVARDRSAELPDGLHVFLCGSGSPVPDPQRAGPCVGVVAGSHVMLFDAGSGGARRLARMGFPTGRIERVYLTHLHSDHFDGLGEVLLQAWVGGSRASPLPIAGPEGVGEVVAGFNAAYRIDSTYRTAHHGAAVANPAGFGGSPEVIVAPGADAGARVVLQDGDLKVSVIAVNHAPISPAFGYRIDYKDRSVVLSGDTVYSPNLVAATAGADVLFHEALRPEMVTALGDAAAARGAANVAKIMYDIRNYHASPEDAARAAAEAKVKLLVIYHIVPPLPSSWLNAAFLGDAHSLFKGKIRVGDDGLLVSLPAGGDRIDQSMIR